MLRIDPAHPPVWRSPTVLQFGAEALARLEDPPPWQLRVLRELERGLPEAAFTAFAEAVGAPSESEAARFLARLRRVLVTDPPDRRVVVLQAAEGVPDSHRNAVGAGLTAAHFTVEVADWFDPVGRAHPTAVAVVLVAHRIVAPAATAALMADDIPHVPVALTGTGADVGPFVVPGLTACLSCVAAHRQENDPAWPAVAAQLLGRPVEAEESVTWEAGIVAGRLITERERRPSRPENRSVTLRAGSLHRNVRLHRPHAACRCRSLEGSATAAAPVHLETTSATAFARPA